MEGANSVSCCIVVHHHSRGQDWRAL
jgi:hypothetical protein